jgi:hypothetical protein
MKWLRAVVREILGLFVDDGSFAIAILAWLALCWLVLPRLPSGMGGLLLVLGLALILVESVLRRARKP